MDLWDRLPDETDAEWRAFASYRDAGLSRTLLSSGLSTSTAIATAKRRSWSARVRAFDAWAEELTREALKSAIEAMAKTRADELTAAAYSGVIAARQEISALLARQRMGDGSGQTMSLSETVRLLKVCSDILRLEDGKPTEIHGISLEGLSPEDLAILKGETPR